MTTMTVTLAPRTFCENHAFFFLLMCYKMWLVKIINSTN